MQDHKTNIPHSCRQTLLKLSQEKDKEKKAEINRQREKKRGSAEKEDREKRNVSSREKCQFRDCRLVVGNGVGLRFPCRKTGLWWYCEHLASFQKYLVSFVSGWNSPKYQSLLLSSCDLLTVFPEGGLSELICGLCTVSLVVSCIWLKCLVFVSHTFI